MVLDQGADGARDRREGCAPRWRRAWTAWPGCPSGAVSLGEHRAEDFAWADLIVRNPAVPRESPWLALARRLGKPVLMELSLFAALCPAPIIGVTGTKGKTTTATWTWEMVRRRWPDAVLAGNLRVSALEQLPRITPDAPVVLEMSSWQLEGTDEMGWSPPLAAVTNLSPDHLNRYRDMDDYAEAKFAHRAPPAARSDTAVLNADDPRSARLCRARAGRGWSGSATGRGRGDRRAGRLSGGRRSGLVSARDGDPDAAGAQRQPRRAGAA